MSKFKLLFVFLFVILISLPIHHVALAKDQGIGVENELNTSNEEAMKGLPSDSELEDQVKDNKADIVEAGQSKKIEKKKGALWDAYKDEIKKEIDKRKKVGTNPKEMKDFAKNFNTETGKLEGKNPFDVERHIQNVSLSTGTLLVNVATEPLKHFTIKPSDVLEAPSAKPMMTAFSSLTDILLALFLVFQLTKIMLMRAIDIGYNGQVIYDKVIRTCIATTFIGLYEPIFKAIMNFQYLLVTPILNAIDVKESTASIVAFKTNMIGGGGPAVGMPLVAILLIVVTLSLFYSLAMYIILYIIGPLAITTMVNDDMDFFSLWLRRLISRILTFLLQSLCVAMCFATLFHITFDYRETITDLMLSISFLFVALSVPKMLENFGDSSGAGRSTLLFIRGMRGKK